MDLSWASSTMMTLKGGGEEESWGQAITQIKVYKSEAYDVNPLSTKEQKPKKKAMFHNAYQADMDTARACPQQFSDSQTKQIQPQKRKLHS